MSFITILGIKNKKREEEEGEGYKREKLGWEVFKRKEEGNYL